MLKIKKDEQTNTTEKVKYQVLNWKSYNKALVNRGDITLYFSVEVVDAWYSIPKGEKGAPVKYSDLCIETLMMFKTVFKLPYRQTQGFTRSLFCIMGLELEVPDYTLIQKRGTKLDVTPYSAPCGGIVIAVDSTGLKVYGEGEWKVRKHGYSKRRTWRKLHLGVDPATGFIHCHSLTLNDVDDGSELGGLLEQVGNEMEDVCLDGAYDHEECWDMLIEKGINPVIPPRKNGVEWYVERPGDNDDYPRNKALRRIWEVGRKKWKEESGYHRRSLSETAMFRYKTIFGNKLYSRTFENQKVENDIKIKALNIMTALGMPISIPIIVA